MRYEVGQVIYLLHDSEMKIFPVRVEEEIIRRRQGSEEINYRVMLPTKSRDVVNLSDLSVTPFTSPADLRSHMVENAIKTVDVLIEKAARFAKNFAETTPEAPVRDDDEDVE